MRTIVSIALLTAVLCSSCAVIAGKEDDSVAARGLSLRFVESLRSEKSLHGERWQEPQFGTSPATSLQQPNSVYADAFRVYVTDTYMSQSVPTPRVFVFDRNTLAAGPLATPSPPAEGKLLSPVAISVDSIGDIFVADAAQGKVFGYARDGRLLIALGLAGDIGRPSGLAFDRVREQLYVADSAEHRVKVFTTTGRLVSVIEQASKGEEGFHTPTSIAFDKRGNLYVLDGNKKRVFIYNPGGALIRRFPLSGETPGTPLKPKGIAIDSDSHLYIPDMASNAVFIYSADGSYITTWGHTGVLAGDFWSPVGIFIDSEDRIYVADQMNGRVQVFQYLKMPDAAP